MGKTKILSQVDYRLVMDPRMAWAFVNAIGHPMRDTVAVRVDLFDEIRHAATRSWLGANSDANQTNE